MKNKQNSTSLLKTQKYNNRIFFYQPVFKRRKCNDDNINLINRLIYLKQC